MMNISLYLSNPGQILVLSKLFEKSKTCHVVSILSVFAPSDLSVLIAQTVPLAQLFIIFFLPELMPF